MSRPAAMSRRSTRSEYIETDTGNKISRRAHIEGKQNIMLGGRSVVMAGVTMRGDLHRKQERSADGEPEKAPVMAISIGKLSVLSTNCTIHPPMRMSHGQLAYYPVKIGDNVFIGPGTYVASAGISSHAHIGANCVLSPFCIIKEGARVLPDSVVPPNMIVPAGCIAAGRPARIISEIGDGAGQGGTIDEWVEGGDLRELVRSIK